jgi:hypothetical protein
MGESNVRLPPNTNILALVKDSGERFDNHDAAWCMETYGGSFVRALANLWVLADAANRAKIEREWSDLFQQYRQVAETYGRKCP